MRLARNLKSVLSVLLACCGTAAAQTVLTGQILEGQTVLPERAAGQEAQTVLTGRKALAGEEALKKQTVLTGQAGAGKIMHYRVIEGDTVYVETLRPAWVWGRDPRDRKNWRRYYRLVHNFSRAYPYAMIAKDFVRAADSTIAASHLKGREREKYINGIQKEIFRSFEKPLRNMTVSQGQLLMKLIDREVGKSSYRIIKDYKNGIAAGFWQGVAKIFKSDMKKHYDPTGADREVEELVEIWRRGDFPYLYYSIFGKLPSTPEMPSKYREYGWSIQSFSMQNSAPQGIFRRIAA